MWNAPAARYSAQRRRLLKSALLVSGASVIRPEIAFAKAESYGGMHDSAGWRREARSRIEANRKRRFSLSVLDAGGRAVANADVNARLARHEFGFGAAVRAGHIFGDAISSEERNACKELMLQEFHKLGAANALKWKWFERDRVAADRLLDWAGSLDIPVRGHTLVWAGFRRAPRPIAELRSRPQALAAAIEEHIAEMLNFSAGRIADWDVLNEPFTENEYMQILGNEIVADWFRKARELDARTGRYINDYGVLTRPSEKHQDFYFDYVRTLIEYEVPVTGVGFQAHNPARFPLTAMPDIVATLDRFASLGLEMQITEFDIERTDEDLQARYMSDFLTAVFSHPGTVGLICWSPFRHPGVSLSKPDASLWREDFSRKPVADAWHDLVNRDWRTEVSRVADSDGRTEFRGFAGYYDVTIQAGSVRQRHRVPLNKDNNSAVVRLH